MENLDEMVSTVRKVDYILKDELYFAGINPDVAESRIYDARTVGVQGDFRTYSYVVEITFNRMRFVYMTGLLDKVSTRITNEVTGINRVVYLLASRKNN